MEGEGAGHPAEGTEHEHEHEHRRGTENKRGSELDSEASLGFRKKRKSEQQESSIRLEGFNHMRQPFIRYIMKPVPSDFDFKTFYHVFFTSNATLAYDIFDQYFPLVLETFRLSDYMDSSVKVTPDPDELLIQQRGSELLMQVLEKFPDSFYIFEKHYHMLPKNPATLQRFWSYASKNTSAIKFLSKNTDNIDYTNILQNEGIYRYLESGLDLLNIFQLLSERKGMKTRKNKDKFCSMLYPDNMVINIPTMNTEAMVQQQLSLRRAIWSNVPYKRIQKTFSKCDRFYMHLLKDAPRDWKDIDILNAKKMYHCAKDLGFNILDSYISLASQGTYVKKIEEFLLIVFTQMCDFEKISFIKTLKHSSNLHGNLQYTNGKINGVEIQSERIFCFLNQNSKHLSMQQYSSYNFQANIFESHVEIIRWRQMCNSHNLETINPLSKHFNFCDRNQLFQNPVAIHLVKRCRKKINWDNMSLNPAAITILQKNFTKINQQNMNRNPNAIRLLENNTHRIISFTILKDKFNILVSRKNTIASASKLASINRPKLVLTIEQDIDILDSQWPWLKMHTNILRALGEKVDDEYSWKRLNQIPKAICLLEVFPEKIYWELCCLNPHAIPLIEKNIHLVCWKSICRNPAAWDIVVRNLEKINLLDLCSSPFAIQIFFTLDTQELKQRNQIIHTQVVQLAMCPNRIARLAKRHNISFKDYILSLYSS